MMLPVEVVYWASPGYGYIDGEYDNGISSSEWIVVNGTDDAASFRAHFIQCTTGNAHNAFSTQWKSCLIFSIENRSQAKETAFPEKPNQFWQYTKEAIH